MVNTLENVVKTGKYTATQTAQLLSISIRTLSNYRRAGKIKAKVSKLNNRYYYTGEEIIRTFNMM